MERDLKFKGASAKIFTLPYIVKKGLYWLLCS